MARRSLPQPDVAVVDPETGLMAPDWYDFFREQFRLSIIALTYGPTIGIDALVGGDYLINVTNGVAFTIAAPTNPVTGKTITLTIRNASGGALGAITWNAVFKLSGGALTAPANGFSRSISFSFNGTNWVERFRSGADVPN